MNTTDKTPFRVIPLNGEAEALRRAAASDQPEKPVVWVDGERHQCRSCLALTLPDEECLLASHRPFSRPQPYAEAGPIFIHRRACEPYKIRDAIPAWFRMIDLVLRAYDRKDQIVGAARVGERPVEAEIAALLADPRVAYLHARNTAYGCYICRIERG